MKDCVFCKIIAGKIPSKKVYEDEDVLAFNDIEPHAPRHILIIPKKHITNLSSAQKSDEKLLGKLVIKGKEIAEQEKIEKAYKLTTNNGKFAGQVVMHMHFHLLGGWKNKAEVKSELHQ